ncbi:PhaM family polyhydroxyalkanoate granule multifunctional regulatory protein [Castellaniella caeni]|uniref:PhaM family polyhydroxyalkanoate granule multifunctional regulatory protein n=1 Tax=Castellaniella caeni TaxID=266123 RepID=UPI0008313391|nr:PhaM family polyhydroxyalkanoate granule multifunctional regulatory protein [Castellaniella caeni]
MTQDSANPFVLPGFGQQGDAAHNPLFAGLDMMRQAWQNLAGAGRMDGPVMPPMSLDDLDRRIRELQTVQNWLQLNATMLANTIQGLEIQRSTFKTLQSFAGGVFPEAAPATKAAASRPSARTTGAGPAEPAASGATDASASAASGQAGQAYAQAAGEWWHLVQQQFEQLREATAASLSSMADATEAAQAAAVQAASSATEAAADVASTMPGASVAGGTRKASAGKPAAKSATPRGVAAKSAAGKATTASKATGAAATKARAGAKAASAAPRRAARKPADA